MTAGGTIQALGMREVRANMRAVVARVEAGEALVVLRDGQPSAVILSFAEAQRWQQIERGLSAFHGLEIYPELARDTPELARIVRRATRPSGAAVRRLADQPRDILAPLRTMGITDARTTFAGILDEIEAGRTLTIVSSGRFAATLVAPREFDRLRTLDRTVSWFRAAGLDLSIADEAEIGAFVRDFATRTAASDAAGEAATPMRGRTRQGRGPPSTLGVDGNARQPERSEPPWTIGAFVRTGAALGGQEALCHIWAELTVARWPKCPLQAGGPTGTSAVEGPAAGQGAAASYRTIGSLQAHRWTARLGVRVPAWPKGASMSAEHEALRDDLERRAQA